jgi:hypothetical protein
MSQKCTFSRPFTILFLGNFRKFAVVWIEKYRCESRKLEHCHSSDFRLSHFFKTTISHLKEEMKVWVKVGTSAVAKVVIDGDAPDIDDLKAAVKMTLVNKFLTTEKDDIVIRDPISKEEISSTKLFLLDRCDGLLIIRLS